MEMKTLSILEGKNKFSKMIADAANGEPYIITKNGKEQAAVISIEEYRRMTSGAKSFVNFMLDNPFRRYGIELDLNRDKDTGRPAVDFGQDDE